MILSCSTERAPPHVDLDRSRCHIISQYVPIANSPKLSNHLKFMPNKEEKDNSTNKLKNKNFIL